MDHGDTRQSKPNLRSLKILVIGGTGAFGSRLCDLLARDGHTVSAASRHAPSEPLPAGVTHVTFDRDAFGGKTSTAAPDDPDSLTGWDVIVDAAGPFHAYGPDPYHIARAAIAGGSHYFDLSDNAGFCTGIAELDAAARTAGVAVLSGLSSAPAISSAVVEALSGGQAPLSIESAIVPGNKAPRGRAVIESILNQTGGAFPETEAGLPVQRRAWSQSRWYDLGPYKRQGWRIELPDQQLFPKAFKCPNVSFRAGLELG